MNELIEYIFFAIKDDGSKVAGDGQPPNVGDHNNDHSVAAEVVTNEFSLRRDASSYNQGTNLAMPRAGNLKGISLDASENLDSILQGEETQQRPSNWARGIEAATQRRKEVLMPENLENMWARGRNYRKKVQKSAGGLQAPVSKGSGLNNADPTKSLGKKISNHRLEISSTEDKAPVKLPPRSSKETQLREGNNNLMHLSHGLNKQHSIGGASLVSGLEGTAFDVTRGNKCRLKRSNSTSALEVQPNMGYSITSEGCGPIISEFYSSDFDRHNDVHAVKSASDMVFRSEGSHTPKLRSRVNSPPVLSPFSFVRVCKLNQYKYRC